MPIMATELEKPIHGNIADARGPILPTVIADAGERAGKRFIEFFTATIRNANTRRAYARAVSDFLAWCHQGRLSTSLDDLPLRSLGDARQEDARESARISYR
jgi:hypothetical protein